MSDKPVQSTPFIEMWLRTQTAMIDAQRPFWESVSKSISSGENDELVRSSQHLWEKSLKAGKDWVAAAFQNAELGEDPGGIARNTLGRMMDPSQFLFAGSDEVNSTIQKLVEGPDHFDAGKLSDLGMQATKEWATLREAGATYRSIILQAWWAAYEKYVKSQTGSSFDVSTSPTTMIRQWFEIANDELIKTQRTKRYLDAQRQLLRAGADYRLKERDLVETWCETHSVPTRSEVDELHHTVYELKKTLRHLTKQVTNRPSLKPPTKKSKSAKSSGDKK